MKRTIEFTTKLADVKDNLISVDITSIDSVEVTKPIEIKNTGIGNHIAVAMDVLAEQDFPLGTKFKVTIETE